MSGPIERDPTEELGGILEEERRGRKAPAMRTWTGGLRQRVSAAGRVASGGAQVVVKITGHYRGARNVRSRLAYIARDGDNVLQTGSGEFVVGAEEIGALVDQWSAEFTPRKNGRDASGFSLSLPPEMVQTEEERSRAEAAVRVFLEREFGANYEYVYAAHDDSGKHHVHVIVNRHGRDGSTLRTNKADLARWREGFARAAQEQGFDVDASPRYARGRGRNAEPDPIFRMRQRGERPRVDDEVEAPEGRAARFAHAARVNAAEREAYAAMARAAAEEARQISEAHERARALEFAAVLGLFSARMPGPEGAQGVAVGRPGWSRAYRDVRATYEVLKEESERLYGAELRDVGRARNELANELERGRAQGAEREEMAELVRESRRIVAGITDPDRRRRADEILRELAAGMPGRTSTGAGRASDADPDVER